MRQDRYILTDEFKITVEENAELIKKHFKPNKSSSIFTISKSLMIFIRENEGYGEHSWCSRSSITPAMEKNKYNYINRRFSITLAEKECSKLLENIINLPIDIIKMILSKVKTDLIYCRACSKIHYDTKKINHRTDFLKDNPSKY